MAGRYRGLGIGLPAVLATVKSGGLGDLHFAYGLFRRVAAGRTESQVPNIGNVPAVVFTVENVDVVIFHSSSASSVVIAPEKLPT